MKEKLQLLRQLEYELHEEEALLDCYTKNVPPDQITFAMELADRANRKAYEYKKEVIETLKKELAQEAEIIPLPKRCICLRENRIQRNMDHPLPFRSKRRPLRIRGQSTRFRRICQPNIKLKAQKIENSPGLSKNFKVENYTPKKR